MNFTFLHCADLHLGSPLLGLSEKDPEIAARFAAASRDAFKNLVNRAIEERVVFVLVAGDIYDGEWRDNSIGLFFNRHVSRLTQAKIPVFLIKGNHDAASVVTSSIAFPDGVTQFSTRRAETHSLPELRVAIHGRSFPHRAVDENWAAEYPAPKAEWLNIGLLHTNCGGRPGHDSYAPCSPADLRTKGYEYWALGHVHEFEIISNDPWIVYPGNLQGRSIRECGAKGAVLVDAVDGRIAGVRRLIVDCARFADIEVDITGAADPLEALETIKKSARPVAAQAAGRMAAVRLRLTGATAAHRDILARRDDFTTDVRGSLNHENTDVWLEKLLIETREPVSGAPLSGALQGIDLAATLVECAAGETLRAAAAKELSSIRQKLPDSVRDALDAEDIEALIAEARALVLGRALGSAG